MDHYLNDRPIKLFTPGPVSIPSRVSAAMSFRHYHHRMNDFSKILEETLHMLQPLFGTAQPIMPVHTTGRGALEGVYNNLFTEKDRILSICNGQFGEMAAATIKCNGFTSIKAFTGWETRVDLDELEKIIIQHQPTAITAVHSDTSNAVVNPLSEIGQLAKKYSLLFVVDTVSGLGCMPFHFDRWGVDAAVTASQKGLMSPAGISFVAMSEKAIDICENQKPRDYYINFSKIRDTVLSKNETPGSTPVSLVVAVNEALHMIHEEGLEQVYHRHQRLSKSLKAAVEALGFPLFPGQCELRSDSLTVCRLPETLKAGVVTSHLRTHYHLMISRGLGEYGDTCLRMAHMGNCYVEDMLQLIAALESTLQELGALSSMGKGLQAFTSQYREFEQADG